MKPLIYIVFVFFYFTGFGQTLIDENSFPSKYRQFDFWIGSWDVNLRQIQSDNTWKDWKQSRAQIYSILDGRAILELWEEKGDRGSSETIIGYSLRYYDPGNDNWVLWLNWPGENRSGSSSLSGEFRHGRGEFFSRRPTSDSTSIISRYTFSDITPTSLRWDDAFSRDEGKTWIHSWIMEFNRVEDMPSWPQGDNLHTYRKGERCSLPEFAEVEKFVGTWSGQVKILNENGKRNKKNITISNYKALGGCSVMSFLEIDGKEHSTLKEFSLFTYNTYASKFEDGRLSNDPNSGYKAYYGAKIENAIELTHRDRQTREPIEKYTWEVNDKKMSFEKWGSKGEEMVKVMEGELKKE